MSADKSGAEKVLDGSMFGYGHWFEPLQETFGTTLDLERRSEDSIGSAEKSERRGRPRKAGDIGGVAREKRRAQIRSAQKTYRERKERATASQEQRCDELLRVISSISTELEELLRVARVTGAMERQDELGERLRRTASCYDSAIEQPCLGPELQLLGMKNRQRRGGDQPTTVETSQNEGGCSSPRSRPIEHLSTVNSNDTCLDMGRIGDSTLIQSFRPHPERAMALGPKTMLALIRKRQAELKAGLPSKPVSARDIEFTQKHDNGELREPLKFPPT